MVIQDMDISLNVTAGPAFSARTNKQRRTESFQTSIKRLKNQSSGKKGIAVNNKKSKDTQDTQSKKRIRQKSLSTIFVKKLKETNTVAHNAQSQIPSRVKDVMIKAPESGKIKQQSDDTDKKDVKFNKVLSVANSNSNITNEQTVSFTKVTKQHMGETLLAKRRDTLIEQKKTLSDIFPSQLNELNKIELNISQKHDIDKDSKLNEKFDAVTKKSPTLKIKQMSILNKRNEKKHKEKTVNNHRESDNTPQLLRKGGGKISSLFGNNPDVPIIGQRLVKPVDEPIFTKITFADLNIHPFMISNLEQNMHITKMTTVQQKAIPEIFSGKDVLIRSQTGSGKTLAYALPIVELLHKIRPKLNRNSGLSALIVVPTRELALQTYECFIKLVKPFTWIVPGYIIGGEKRKAEKARLRKGCNILITTPGRLLDHIKHTKALRLNEVRYFILDEADRMLEMGYEKNISEIVNALKVSNHNNESGYDAMKIFKQNIKNISTDKNISKEDDIKFCSKIEKNHINDKMRHMDNSNDDNKDDNQVIIKGKEVSKGREKDTKYSSMNQEFDSKAENAQNIEQDCKDVTQSRRKTILLSATLTQAVEKLAGLAMYNPIFVDAAKENLETSGGDTSEINEDLIVPQSVIQSYIVTPPKLRMVTLSAYIVSRCQTPGQHKILIFMATQDMVDYHTEILSSILTESVDDNDDEDSDPLVNVEFFKLHGNMTQKERTEVFKTFSRAKSGVLLCTDVAARGLDMPKVDCVVQYTGPISTRDYVHRIGRTARAGCSGTATIFLTPSEVEFVRMLESRRIRIKQQNMNDILDKLLGPLSKHNSVQAAAIALQNNFENLVLENKQLGAKAYKAYTSWMRFYSSYPRDMREIFNRKELHLGHYAKSFALRDSPHRIGGIGKKLREKEGLKPNHNNRLHKPSDGVPQKEQRKQNGDRQRTGLLKRARMLNTSEYDSGLGPIKKSKKSSPGVV
ncbi:probable ATP-dependent RNA helicase CG8611 [Camponotus floridanus]|uniref:probable ATP-dependent RNA helicase CG8611 n=1 Tax=Camponotus floridanus TaxID=104421 RepID=UPI000DC680DE|nr:probable ATP-dependent RNA helicase CG8611 [Camponotus floridanus]